METKKILNEDYLNILDDNLLSDEEYEKVLLDGYETNIHIDKNEDFHIQTLEEYFQEDIKELEFDKHKEFFHLTKAFKYFNGYHFSHYQSNKLYKIFNNKIQGYGDIMGFAYLKNIDGKKVNLFPTLYDNCIQKNKYSAFIFEPELKKRSDAYNLFRGFKYDNEKIQFDQSKIQTYLNHIKFICNGDEEVYNYFISWMAHVIQKPGTKTDVAIVIYSLVEGIGKNIIWDGFAKLLEGYAAKFRDTNALTDKFNSDMMGKIFVIGDEIKARAQEVADELKDIITRKEENVEFKGKDKFIVKDFKNYAFK